MSLQYLIDLFQTYREPLFNKHHRIKKIANRKFALAKTDDLLPKFLTKDGAPSRTRSRQHECVAVRHSYGICCTLFANVNSLSNLSLLPQLWSVLVPWDKNKIGVKPDLIFGAPSRTRTCNPQIRNLLLYPVEPWAHVANSTSKIHPLQIFISH